LAAVVFISIGISCIATSAVAKRGRRAEEVEDWDCCDGDDEFCHLRTVMAPCRSGSIAMRTDFVLGCRSSGNRGWSLRISDAMPVVAGKLRENGGKDGVGRNEDGEMEHKYVKIHT
jgi:hypothetical protein